MKDISDVGYVIDPEIWLTPREAAKHFGCVVRTLYNKKHKGELPEDYIMTDGHFWYIRKDAPVILQKSTR